MGDPLRMRAFRLDRRRWLTAVAFIAGALSVSATAISGGADQPPAPTRTPEPSLRERTIRVGLPSPIGARGMLRGTRDDPQGYLRELFGLIAQAEGLKVEFIAIDKEDGANPGDELELGRIDVLAGIAVNELNLHRFRLSSPVVVTPGAAVTRSGTRPPKTVDDLRSLRIAVPAGGAGRTFAAEQNLTVIPKMLYRENFIAVASGEADATLTTLLAASYEIDMAGEAYRGLQVSELEPVGFRRAYAYAVRTSDSTLMAAIESGLLTLHQDGRFRTTYEREVAKYQPLDGPRSVELSSVIQIAAAVGGGLLALAIAWQWTLRRRLVSLTRVLSESERRYRGIFDNSQDTILVIDPQAHTVLEANAAAERTYGYGAGEMTGVHVNDLVTEPDMTRERIRQVVDGEKLSVTRSRHRRRDGRPLVMDVHASMGTIGGRSVLLAIIRDVTAAFSHEELIRSVIETSPHVSIQAFDRNGCVHFWNEASTRLYGWTAQEAIGRKVGELIGTPEDQAALVELLARLESERRPSGLMEFQVHNKAGEPRWVLSEIVPAPNVLGELQFVCVDIDVTAMKLAEQSLQDAQARLASALEAAGTGTWSVDVQLQTVDPDPSLLRLMGFDPTVSGLRPFNELAGRVFPEDLPHVMAALEAAMRGERPYHAEFRVALPGGGTRWLSSRGKLIRDAKGEVVTISGASVDITETKLASADAERLRDELERARRLESLGLLAGGLAHDFNNLLVGIRGNTELALSSLSPDSPAHRALDLVVQATDRTADLTNQLLAAAGRSRLEPEPIDLNAAVIESVALLRPRLGRRVTVDFELADPAVRTRADGAQTRQALCNLLTNAADATSAVAEGAGGGGRIVVRSGTQHMSGQDFEDDAYKVRSTPGDYAYIEVADNGCGMDERVLARVFDPFYTTKATGRGLGLSLVMMTVRRHEGAIRIDSQPGRGTVCRLLLPLVATPQGCVQRTATAEPAGTGCALVIDDEPMVRQVIAGMLTHCGWSSTEAASGEVGIACAAEQRFDIVFLDLTMPGLSGSETAAVLRASAPGLPIVFVSGYSREMADSGGVLAGEVFVQKPFTAGTLMAAAAEAIQRVTRGESRGAVSMEAAHQPEP